MSTKTSTGTGRIKFITAKVQLNIHIYKQAYAKKYMYTTTTIVDLVYSCFRVQVMNSDTIKGWLYPYMELLITTLDENQLRLAIAGDIIFASSLFVPGGDFWLKIKALLTHDLDCRR